MPTRPKYPEALDKANTYRTAEIQLRAKMAIIKRAVDINVTREMVQDDALLGGAYYNVYAQTCDSWLDKVQKRQGEFATYHDDLQKKLERIMEFKNLWDSRVYETEEYTVNGK